MKFKNIDYPYSLNSVKDNSNKEKILSNFERFIKYAKVDRIASFSVYSNFEKAFRGKNIVESYSVRHWGYSHFPDHPKIYRNSKTKQTYIVSFEYNEPYGQIQKFCDKFNVSCIILPNEYNFYIVPNLTNMTIYAHKEELKELMVLYGLKKVEKFFKPKISFFKDVMNYKGIDTPERRFSKRYVE